MSGSIFVTTEHKQRQLWSSRVILVPYERHLVPTYNRWMQDTNLQYLTGSEPLTLEAEFEMHESWCKDCNKCTFIVLERSKYEALANTVHDEEERQIESMIGDVNFYINQAENALAEIEIMIAVASQRQRGFGRAAALAMMKFAHQIVGINQFEAKIKYNNVASQNLFVNVFGFVEISRSDVFEEITFLADLNQDGVRLKQMLNETQVEYRLN